MHALSSHWRLRIIPSESDHVSPPVQVRVAVSVAVGTLVSMRGVGVGLRYARGLHGDGSGHGLGDDGGRGTDGLQVARDSGNVVAFAIRLDDDLALNLDDHPRNGPFDVRSRRRRGGSGS